MQNKLIDLNNHLFELLEKIKDDSVFTPETSDFYMKQASITNEISKQIIEVHKVAIAEAKVINDYNIPEEQQGKVRLLEGKV